MRPVINWHSFVGTTDGASWYNQFKKYPWEDPQEFAVRSPLSYVANVKTPTMVMTGEADLRTPMAQSEEYYRAQQQRIGHAEDGAVGANPDGQRKDCYGRKALAFSQCAQG